MSNNRVLSVLAVLGFMVVGCNGQSVKVTNGELPQELLPYAKAYVGNYTARSNSLEDESGIVQISLVGSKLVVTPDWDFLGDGCGSKIGDLEEVSVESNQSQTPVLSDATFALLPGRCDDIVSEIVTFSLGSGNTYQMNYIKGRPGGKHDRTVTWTLTRQN